jgi:hypothetical protein
MTVAALLAEAREAGISFSVGDGKLKMRAKREPPPELVARIRAARPVLLAMLGAAPHEPARKHNQPAPRSPAPSPASTTWTAEDWRTYYLERAAIRELDGHLSRAEADRRAWRETANRYWHQHGSRSAPSVCCGCGKPVSLAGAIPLPHDQRVHDADCMAAFGRRWLKEAAEALAKFGIPAPPAYGPDAT